MYSILMCTNMFTVDRDCPVVYIEYTNQTLQQRLQYHLYNIQLDEPKEHIHKAIKALGTKFFKWEVLEQCESEKEALELLKYYQTEYKSTTIGYNAFLDDSFAGENNPMWDDHRTWDERFGKEKADEMKQSISDKKSGTSAPHIRFRNLTNNPTDDPKVRAKISKSAMGAKNSQALYDYILTRDDGTKITIECIREYCREHKDVSKTGLLMAAKLGKKYKGMTVEKVDKAKGV